MNQNSPDKSSVSVETSLKNQFTKNMNNMDDVLVKKEINLDFSIVNERATENPHIKRLYTGSTNTWHRTIWRSLTVLGTAGYS